MFNIIDLCTKGVSKCFNGTCYLFNRVVECCCGKPRAKLAGNAGGDASLVDLSVRGSSVVPENKVLSVEEKEILGLIVEMKNADDRPVRLHAMLRLEEIVRGEQSTKMIDALLIQFTSFLNTLGRVELELFVEDNRREIQLFVLGLLPDVIRAYGKQDKAIQDVIILDSLVSCLIEIFANTLDSGQDSILNSLFERQKCIESSNLEILEKELKLMITLLSDPVYKSGSRFENAEEIICLIMVGESEMLAKYSEQAKEAITAYTERKEAAKAKRSSESQGTSWLRSRGLNAASDIKL